MPKPYILTHAREYSLGDADLDRNEAVTCLREITVLASMALDSVSLSVSKPGDLSVGYQVHIKAVFDEETERQIRVIAQKRELSLTKNQDELIIYSKRSGR